MILLIKFQQILALSDAQSAAGDLPSGGPRAEKHIFYAITTTHKI